MPNPSASPGLVVVNGKDYLMAPLTDRNLGEITNFIRTKFIKTALEAIDPLTPQRVVDSVTESAMREARSLNWMRDPELVTGDLENAIYMLWVSFRKHQPDLVRATLGEDIMKDADALEDCVAMFQQLQSSWTNTAGNAQQARTPNNQSNNQGTKAKRKRKKNQRTR